MKCCEYDGSTCMYNVHNVDMLVYLMNTAYVPESFSVYLQELFNLFASEAV